MDDNRSSTGSQNPQHEPSERLRELADKHGGMSPGMTSPDSTQAPLRADTGEPDPAAQRGGRGDEPVEDEDGR